MRIVTLLPAATEMVCALGLEECLVGRSHECDFPVWVEKLPTLTRARVDSSLSSVEIDEQVQRVLSAGGPLYEVKESALAALDPDVVVTQEACEVCAVSFEQVSGCVERAGLNSRVVSLGPERLEDVLTDVGTVAEACGVTPAGRELKASLEARLAALEAGWIAPKPRVGVVEWLDPPMLAGHWVPDVVEAAGGHSLGPAPGAVSPYLSWEELGSLAPDILVVSPCGFGLSRVEVEAAPCLSMLQRLAPRVLLLDGNAYLNRPGPRLVDAAELLAPYFSGQPFSPSAAGREIPA